MTDQTLADVEEEEEVITITRKEYENRQAESVLLGYLLTHAAVKKIAWEFLGEALIKER